ALLVPLETRSLRTHPFASNARARPGETPVRTAPSSRYLIRMRSQVQVQPGPPDTPQVRASRSWNRRLSVLLFTSGPRRGPLGIAGRLVNPVRRSRSARSASRTGVVAVQGEASTTSSADSALGGLTCSLAG